MYLRTQCLLTKILEIGTRAKSEISGMFANARAEYQKIIINTNQEKVLLTYFWAGLVRNDTLLVSLSLFNHLYRWLNN
jgi:hypothetical protein